MKWIQKTKLKKGVLSKQLRIPEERNIPFELLQRIKKAPIGTHIRNPNKIGKRIIPVTEKLKKRAVLALTLKRIKRK